MVSSQYLKGGSCVLFKGTNPAFPRREWGNLRINQYSQHCNRLYFVFVTTLTLSQPVTSRVVGWAVSSGVRQSEFWLAARFLANSSCVPEGKERCLCGNLLGPKPKYKLEGKSCKLGNMYTWQSTVRILFQPGFAPHSVYVVDEVARGQVSSRLLLFSLSLYFHRGSPYSYYLEVNNRPVVGRSWDTGSHQIDMNTNKPLYLYIKE
jgi:hypothetical protein